MRWRSFKQQIRRTAGKVMETREGKGLARAYQRSEEDGGLGREVMRLGASAQGQQSVLERFCSALADRDQTAVRSMMREAVFSAV